MLTHLLRTRPAVGFALALLISAFVTLVGVGGAVAGADDSPGTAVFLGFVGAVGVLMIVSVGLEALRRVRRPFARVGTSPEGEPATVLPFSGAALASPVVLLLLVLVAGAVGATVALGEGVTTWVVICAVVAATALVLLLPVLAGRVRAGGVYLTPQGLEHRRLFLVASYQQHPELRDRLGTPASLDWGMLDTGS